MILQGNAALRGNEVNGAGALLRRPQLTLRHHRHQGRRRDNPR